MVWRVEKEGRNPIDLDQSLLSTILILTLTICHLSHSDVRSPSLEQTDSDSGTKNKKTKAPLFCTLDLTFTVESRTRPILKLISRLINLFQRKLEIVIGRVI
jgi:hypothetical protein